MVSTQLRWFTDALFDGRPVVVRPAATWGDVVGATVVGALGLAVTLAVVWHTVGRRLWQRAERAEQIAMRALPGRTAAPT